ncbi:MAG: hypothetical protein J6T35_03445 [Bacteroidales bacterium]|nr:hypothetical protein [Bacteroidales bacterium]
MKRINLIKDCAIVADFIVSGIASALQGTNPSISGVLFGVSAVLLFVALVCVIVGWVKKKQ